MNRRPDYRVLSNRTMVLAGVLLLLAGAGVAAVLLAAFGQGTAVDRNRLEVIRTVATVVVGAGGACGLWLLARKQRSAEIALLQKEIDQSHAERVAAATEADATERRLTELFTKAADQLGSDRPPVRLAGAHALARLGENSQEQRQVVVDVLCTYLRMPDEEREVRRSVQKVLADKLRTWPGIDLDLSGALLHDCDLRGIEVRQASFAGAVFRDSVAFCRPAALCHGSDFPTTFDGHVDFTAARFEGDAHFGKVEFLGEGGWTVHQWVGRDGRQRGAVSSGAQFKDAVFVGAADFAQARFAGEVSGLA